MGEGGAAKGVGGATRWVGGATEVVGGATENKREVGQGMGGATGAKVTWMGHRMWWVGLWYTCTCTWYAMYYSYVYMYMYIAFPQSLAVRCCGQTVLLY